VHYRDRETLERKPKLPLPPKVTVVRGDMTRTDVRLSGFLLYLECTPRTLSERLGCEAISPEVEHFFRQPMQHAPHELNSASNSCPGSDDGGSTEEEFEGSGGAAGGLMDPCGTSFRCISAYLGAGLGCVVDGDDGQPVVHKLFRDAVERGPPVGYNRLPKGWGGADGSSLDLWGGPDMERRPSSAPGNKRRDSTGTMDPNSARGNKLEGDINRAIADANAGGGTGAGKQPMRAHRSRPSSGGGARGSPGSGGNSNLDQHKAAVHRQPARKRVVSRGDLESPRTPGGSIIVVEGGQNERCVPMGVVKVPAPAPRGGGSEQKRKPQLDGGGGGGAHLPLGVAGDGGNGQRRTAQGMMPPHVASTMGMAGGSGGSGQRLTAQGMVPPDVVAQMAQQQQQMARQSMVMQQQMQEQFLTMQAQMAQQSQAQQAQIQAQLAQQVQVTEQLRMKLSVAEQHSTSPQQQPQQPPQQQQQQQLLAAATPSQPRSAAPE
jgi:hypothetical protein